MISKELNAREQELIDAIAELDKYMATAKAQRKGALLDALSEAVSATLLRLNELQLAIHVLRKEV